MKRIIIALIVFMGMASHKTLAYDIAVENEDGITIFYEYTGDGKNLMVVGCGYCPDTLRIPDEVTYMNRTRKVVIISDFSYNGGALSVIIGKNVLMIGSDAFKNCSLKYLKMGSGVEFIGESAFNHLEKIDFPSYECLFNITYCSYPIKIAGNLYINGELIKDLVIPNYVTSIADHLFDGCRSLTSVTIPNSVTSIGKETFSGCRSLVSVAIPNSITTIGEGAFRDCTHLTKLNIPNGVTSIEDVVFYNCRDLASISLPNSIISIGWGAFQSCSSLKSIVIPNSVITIGSQAFYESGIQQVTIGNSVKDIGSSAFNSCNLESVIIPNSVKAIGDNAFAYNEKLTTLTIGEGVTSIGGSAFSCDNLMNVISLIRSNIPTAGEIFPWDDKLTNAFSHNTLWNATLYVPYGTAEAYKSTEGWKNFVWIEEELPAEVERMKYVEKTIELSCNSIDGTKLVSPQKGINIVKMSDGTTKKVLVK